MCAQLPMTPLQYCGQKAREVRPERLPLRLRHDPVGDSHSLSAQMSKRAQRERRAGVPRLIVLLMLFGVASGTHAAIIRVGPGEVVRTIAEASQLARDGDVVEIVAGIYQRDVAVWSQREIIIRGVGGIARVVAKGAAAEGKGTFVIRSERARVENLEFVGSRVPDRNGAGIRLESGKLTVVGCRFIDNENGMLVANDERIELVIERSEFGYNGAGDGQSHNLYVGSIARLVVTGSYFHHARVGHLLKSRARENRIAYNRLTDEVGGSASYELEFPSGGRAVVVGNLIQQASTTENPTILSMGAEGLRWPDNRLYLSHNTIVNERHQGARALDARVGVRVVAVNNLLVGSSMSIGDGDGYRRGNASGERRDFVLPQREDYRLREDSSLLRSVAPAGEVDGEQLTPMAEYVHPLGTRPIAPKDWAPGAFQTR
jgi:hypothetical protein